MSKKSSTLCHPMLIQGAHSNEQENNKKNFEGETIFFIKFG
jgi:hypothetical protein